MTTPENLNDWDNCTRLPHNTVWKIRERVFAPVSSVLNESDVKYLANMRAFRKKLSDWEIPTAKSENEKRTGEFVVAREMVAKPSLSYEAIITSLNDRDEFLSMIARWYFKDKTVAIANASEERKDGEPHVTLR